MILLIPVQLRLDKLLLPHRIIFILNAERLQRFSCIELRHFFNQYADRRTIGNNMVHIKQQQMLCIRKLDERHSDQRQLIQFERTDKRVNNTFRFPFSCFCIFHFKLSLVPNALHGFSIFDFKGCSEGLVTVNQLSHHTIKFFNIQLALQSQNRRHIVAFFGSFQLLQDVHPFLRRRNGIGFLFLRRSDVDGCLLIGRYDRLR
ncbi:hypothetical protein B4144_0353 [Bacillus atrophaeus]|nr:hypothetical protein B4144_0353 [Bacillus atrophaeus]